jgi:NTE family protein
VANGEPRTGVGAGVARTGDEFSSLPLNDFNAPPADKSEKLEDGIALCLSGGGYRATIFHVGVLWRLNEAALLGKLARVSSVSGGSITAAALGMFWKRLQFKDGIVQNLDKVFGAIRSLAGRTIDEGSVVGGLLMPGTIGDKVAAAYEKHLFGKATLQDFPADGEGPRFILNATNVQTGSLWRFSRPYTGDWQVGLIRDPNTPLAKAVAASSAFPPVLSPVTLDVSPDRFDPTTKGPLFRQPFNDTVVLSDGGVYDNLGLETAIKRYKTVLVSDAGQKMGAEEEPKGDWARHALRVMGLIDNQVRSLRKRQLIDTYLRGVRTGAYWSTRSTFENYARDANPALSDPLGIARFDPSELAAVPTRLKAMPAAVQERLINWGYAICDTALRRHVDQALRPPTGFPFPRGL